MTIALTCQSCDKPLKVKDELSGKKIKCPGCGEIIAVPREKQPAASAVQKEEPRPKPSFEDDEEDRPRKKKKKKKKSNNLLLIGIGAGVLLLLLFLLGGFGVWFFFLRGSGEKTQAETKKPPPVVEEVPKQQPQHQRPKSGIPRGMDLQTLKNSFKQIGLAYHNYLGQFNKGPATAKDLMPFMENSTTLENLLTDGSVVFIYNVRVQDMIEGSVNTILAYEKDADNKGLRVVLFGSGAVDVLPDAEFQSKPKAQGR
jgi:hypothetical protein